MNKSGCCFVIVLILLAGSIPSHAAKVKAYVNRFSVSVPENRDELKVSLQTLLMSRLNGDEIQTVESLSDAEIDITGSYIVFGTVFSLDAVVKTSSGQFIDRVFVQGDTQNELIPSVSEMAKRLRRSILKWNPALAALSTGTIPPVSAEALPKTAVKKDIRPEAKPAAKARPAVKAVPVINAVPELIPEKPWVSPRLPEALNGIARGRTTAAEGTEIFVAGERTLRYYLKGKELQFLSEIVFEAEEKIIGLDIADLDQNGVPELYVTVLKGSQPASQVYLPRDKQLIKVNGSIPYLLRGLALEGKERKIFAQKLDGSGNFSGDVYELAKSGDSFAAKNPLQLPLFGNLYNFNRFTDAKGKRYFIVAHPDGYLLVYAKDKQQLWKSRDKFGGSEALLCPAATADPSSPQFKVCSFSPAQRLLVTRNGEIVVSRNSGLTTSGSTRNYAKNNVVQLFWNGTSLQEKRRLEQSQHYLADFSYDEKTGELLLLELEPKGESLGERGSRIVVNRWKN